MSHTDRYQKSRVMWLIAGLWGPILCLVVLLSALYPPNRVSAFDRTCAIVGGPVEVLFEGAFRRRPPSLILCAASCLVLSMVLLGALSAGGVSRAAVVAAWVVGVLWAIAGLFGMALYYLALT